MSLTLRVDGDRWRAHLRATVGAMPGLTPVIKGNGYGFGNARLARRAAWLGPDSVDTVAVGTYAEIVEIASRFPGDLLVLTPWRPSDGQHESDPTVAKRVIHTVSRVADLEALATEQPDARIVLERTTSMLRHGMSAPDLRSAGRALEENPALSGLQLQGVAMHLPLALGSHVAEVERLMTDVISAGLDKPDRRGGLDRRAGPGGTKIWVSHLKPDELARLNAGFPDFSFRPRVGTDLWLGDRGSMKVTATVQDVHPVERGDVFGYRGRTVPRAGHLLVVSGGTAHGIGLEAPLGDASMLSRAATLARGGLDAVGFVRSPFSIGGKQRLFAEPPHMQASMLFLPGDADVPQVGDEVDVRVRFTATDVDRVEIS